ncbi:hypothetical protein LC653_40740 [Nostoc sp. CHAB 5784]|uniref:hypothetical protein n=1 Tax=Nostoc mirabile TaxID=2907820 RepID=UPI001E570428|nr:hypothetical protein [Nostoc mirabile]MCC5669966.1 hypothetical protein [Nostoc mirabile CHAB5784]
MNVVTRLIITNVVFDLAILNVVTRLIITNVVFDLKFFLFLVTSLLSCTLNIKFSEDSSKYDEVRSERIQSNPNPTTQLIKDVLVIIIGVVFSQLLYYADKSSFFWLATAAILLGRYISIISMYLDDIIAGNRVVTTVTQQINNPGLYEKAAVKNSIDKWEKTNGVIEKLLRADTSRQTTRVITPNSDITAYSFDRLVVCDKDSIAQFLIANNFHFERNCAILSISGYPQNIFEITMQMLGRNPDLQVYALHDCSPQGVSLVYQLRTDAQWFRDSNVTIFDVGILPRQVFKSQKIWITRLKELALQAKSLPTEIQQSLNTEELKWLMEGNRVELESFQPQKLIQILNHSIATNQHLALDEQSLIIADQSTNTYLYAAENFG